MDETSFFKYAKKAFVASGVAFVGSVAGAVNPILADGKVTGVEVAVAISIAVGAAAAAFGATFAVSNAPKTLEEGQ